MPLRAVQVFTNGVLVGAEQVDVPQTDINRDDISAKAQQALAVNAAFLALAAPTNAQVIAQTQRLTRETTAVIRLLLGLLDDTSGT